MLPLDGGDVAEARVEPAVVVGVDPGEDRPPGGGPIRESVTGYELTFQRRKNRAASNLLRHPVNTTVGGTNPLIAGFSSSPFPSDVMTKVNRPHLAQLHK